MRCFAFHVLVLVLLAPAELSIAQARQVEAVLAFPEPGLDDTAAYQGYQTRLFRDSRGNTVQIYLTREGRVVHLWADAANESIGFTVRDSGGPPTTGGGAGGGSRLRWGSPSATVTDSGAVRALEYHLEADASRVEIGWFLLGSMRVERDFQYARRHLAPFGAPRYRLPEYAGLLASLERLPPAERRRHLTLLGARNVAELRARLDPVITQRRTDTSLTIRVAQPSLDGRNHLALELRVDPRQASARAGARTVTVRSRSGQPLRLAVRVATDAAPLTPLTRQEIFSADFLGFLAAARAAAAAGGADTAAALRSRWLERQVRGAELLSAREKLMAGLPNFATYFGRDMMMTALMMQPIWSEAMPEHVIASVLRKLSPSGQVSHEEALGGQAIREAAAEYSGLVERYLRAAGRGERAAGDSLLARAREVLRDAQRVRENYHMLDDEFQLPVLAARYLADPRVSADRKRAFLRAPSQGAASNLALLLREMSLVASLAAPYARDPVATNLAGFPRRDSTHWFPGSWRDSNAGYANGRFAMDINAVWVPQALEGIAAILDALRALGVGPQALDSLPPDLARSPLGAYARDPQALRRDIATWRGAARHFRVLLAPEEVRSRIRAKLSWLPAEEARHWEGVLAREAAARDSLAFLALSLDSAGRPIPVANTDPATRLYLEDLTAPVRSGALVPEDALREVSVFTRHYPAGLFVEGLGPLVANDVYAPRDVWEAFRRDAYHSPRVVWGREVNLFLLGLAKQIAATRDTAGGAAAGALEVYARGLRDALRRTVAAVEASGLKHNELWSYRIESGRLIPTRYGTSSDVQLWNITDLAVQYALQRIGNRE